MFGFKKKEREDPPYVVTSSSGHTSVDAKELLKQPDVQDFLGRLERHTEGVKYRLRLPDRKGESGE